MLIFLSYNALIAAVDYIRDKGLNCLIFRSSGPSSLAFGPGSVFFFWAWYIIVRLGVPQISLFVMPSSALSSMGFMLVHPLRLTAEGPI